MAEHGPFSVLRREETDRYELDSEPDLGKASLLYSRLVIREPRAHFVLVGPPRLDDKRTVIAEHFDSR